MSRNKLSLADSNMPFAGSDLEKKIREANAQREEAWAAAGKEVGLEVFRIEKFQVKPWPKEKYGQFCDGDSYIILQTRGEGLYDVFYWLGMFTSQDEAGTAAIKCVELDDALGGKPIQHREVQGAESGQFMDLFNGEVRVLEGGVESGFKQAEELKLPVRLFHFRSNGGIKSTKMYQRTVAAENLNEDDVFILDNDRDVYIFQGSTSSPGERMMASTTANRIAANRARGCRVTVVSSSDAPEDFWKLLGGKIEVKAQPDLEKLTGRGKNKNLYKVSNAEGGEVRITTVLEKQEKIPLSELKSEDAFILDCGNEVLVWIGSGASAEERLNAMPMAQKFLNEKGRPAQTPISRVLEGAEGAFFKEITTE